MFFTHQGWSETYLISLFTSWNRASKWLLFSSVHAHRTEDGLGADGALCGPRFVTVRSLKVHIVFITLASFKSVDSTVKYLTTQPARYTEWTTWPHLLLRDSHFAIFAFRLPHASLWALSQRPHPLLCIVQWKTVKKKTHRGKEFKVSGHKETTV